VLALPAHDDVFGGEVLEEVLGFLLLLLQCLDLSLLPVDDVELAADIPFRYRLLDVVAAVDGNEEMVQRGLHVSLVKGTDGIGVFLVGLGLLQGLADDLRIVVVALGIVHDILPDKDLAALDGGLQRDALQGTAAREGHVGLAAGEDSAREVDAHVGEGKSLALVYGDSPGQPQGELGIGSQLLLFDLLLLLVVGVLHVAPNLAFHIHLLSVFGSDEDMLLLVLVKGNDGAQGAVDPAVLSVVLDKQHLGAELQMQFLWGREAVEWEIALCHAHEDGWIAGQLRQLSVIDEVDRVAAGGQCDGEFIALDFAFPFNVIGRC